MKHIQTFSNSGDVQTALNEETLINPYVALVSGTSLDYNSLEPVHPCYIGEWTNDSPGHYTFHVLDYEKFGGFIPIGTLKNVYYNGSHDELDVVLNYDMDIDLWLLQFTGVTGSANVEHSFYVPELWYCDEVTTEPESSTAGVQVERKGFFGNSTFEFFMDADDAPALSMTTINPECLNP